jgi:LacI family transcriptional regulator
VVLKAPDAPEVAAAVQRLGRAGIPVVTLVTDLPGSGRLAYVGMDNRAAGATAAYLLGQWLGDRPGNVLVTVSSSAFRGEEEREMGFRAAMRTAQSARTLVEVTGSEGLDSAQRDLVLDALARDPDLAAVYSIGGGNLATVGAFDAVGRHCAVFVAHDLDEDNLRLLHAGRLSAVLHHDLGRDLREACRVIMQAQGALPHRPPPWPSTIQVVTPFNVPAPPD